MEIVGIDPGLVHTGVVMIRPLAHVKAVEILHEAIVGPDADAAADWIRSHSCYSQAPVRHRAMSFIEGYRQRGSFNTNDRMIAAVADFNRVVPQSKVINNTGVKKVVRRPLMDLLEVWSFPTKTNHQDLRSAARIGIYGALKHEVLNEIFFNIVNDHLNGRTWDVRHL